MRRWRKFSGAKVIIVTQGGIGKPIDEVCLNQALFEKEGVEIIGVILNKVLDTKVDSVTDFARRGLKRKGLDLLGVIPHQRILSNPTMELIRDELRAEVLNTPEKLHGLVDDVVVGAMGAHNAMDFFKPGVLLITPGDREDIVLAACTSLDTQSGKSHGGHRAHRQFAPFAGRPENHSRDAHSGFAGETGQLRSRVESSRFDRQNPSERRGKNFAHSRFDREECGFGKDFEIAVRMSFKTF